MKQSLALIDDLIHLEKLRDEEFKKMAVLAHKCSLATGESAFLTHLKTLRQLVEIEFRNATTFPHISPPEMPDYPSSVFEELRPMGKPETYRSIDEHPDCKVKPFQL